LIGLEYIVTATAFIGVLLFFWGISSMLGGSAPESLEARMQRYAGGPQQAQAPEAKKDRKRSRRDIDPFATLSGDVQDKRFSSLVQRDLARADLRLRVAEYYYIRVGLALGLAAVLLLLRDPVSALVGALLGYFVPRVWVGRRISSRLNAFNKQLPDTIMLLSNSLRAGSSFLQSIELVSRESPAPMGSEMGRVVREVNLGLSMEEALSNLVRRIKSDDLDLMVTAIGVQQQVGGNLAEVLDTIAFTIRERVRIKGEIRTLTAQGRYSGYLVAFLPIAIAVTLNFINPEFMQPLFTELIGQILLVIGGIMMAIGFFAIRKITDIKV
jgi:tight adherence protein B